MKSSIKSIAVLFDKKWEAKVLLPSCATVLGIVPDKGSKLSLHYMQCGECNCDVAVQEIIALAVGEEFLGSPVEMMYLGNSLSSALGGLFRHFFIR